MLSHGNSPKNYLIVISLVFFAAACASKPKNKDPRKSDHDIKSVSNEVATLNAELNKPRPTGVSEQEHAAKKQLITKEVDRLEVKIKEKRDAKSLARRNSNIMKKAMEGHTAIYPFAGEYKVLVIPVQFSDVKFSNPNFFESKGNAESPANDYLFGDHPNSFTQYYKHESMGALNVTGQFSSIVTLDGKLSDFGEAVEGKADKDAKGLVAKALLKLKEQGHSDSWWEQFDRWDLSDYDDDSRYYEPDGFMDAVVLVYAGKSQASCQRAFDKDGERPTSASVPEGPRKAATVECFNRIWPHRWSISISKDDPLYSKEGPVVEGIQRPAMNGLKISENLFALDYNMQSEFSDRSTFFHEFGHSLSLPDVYASSGSNSTGAWTLMSSNASGQGQELSSYSKISLGWLNPKVIRQGQKTSLYLGNFSFVANERREDPTRFYGPVVNEELFEQETQTYDILSTTPEFGEPVYRSAVVLTEPTEEKKKVVDFVEETHGKIAAYTGRYDGNSKALKFKFKVPESGDATFKFSSIYAIETETNFNGTSEEIKVVTDYDIGNVVIDGEIVEELRTVSGDSDFDSLAEQNPLCEATNVLALRLKKIAGTLTEEEKKQFEDKLKICVAPIWIDKSYDLSAKRGKEVEVEIRYITDAGYTEFGIVIDNVKFAGQSIDFEDGKNLGEWKSLENGFETVVHNQFYLMEYRSVGDHYNSSYNMDNNIAQGSQSFFLPESQNLTTMERFRMVTMQYQPGVLVWYYNSKFGRSANNASKQEGKGYLLVLNSQPGEMTLPGVFSDKSLFDKNGHYDVEGDKFKKFVEDQKAEYVCFSHIEYATYQTGERPNCDGPFANAMTKLKLGKKELKYRRERFNEILPTERDNFHGVGVPFRTNTQIRTGISTFRPPESESYQPFKVYMESNGEMVIDKTLTAMSSKVAAVSSFSDKDQVLSEFERFKGDTVIVEKKGFSFKVVSPSPRISKLYTSEEATDNDHIDRKPKAKILINWE